MRVAVLVSGGVDSSVALRLIQRQGYEPVAFYIKIWLEDELAYLGDCPWQEDLKYVQAVCSQAQVPLEVVSLQREYWQEVVTYTIQEVKAGRTPNPDVLCNQRIKFGAFIKALEQDFDYIATGHYARVEHHQEYSLLYRSPDALKDQTYFLSYLNQSQLSKALFPLGDLCKEQVRALAHEFDLPTKDRKDSQGICFLGKLKFQDFLRHHLGEHKGILYEYETGKKLGEHAGFWYYTIGQRQGIGLSGGPWYVVAKDVKTNSVYISRSYYDPVKLRNNFTVESMNWIPVEPVLPAQLQVKLRHGERMHESRVTKNVNNLESYHVDLLSRDQGIAPGQFAVFYEGMRCLGGGVISQALESNPGQVKDSLV